MQGSALHCPGQGSDTLKWLQANTVGMVEAGYQPGILVGSLDKATPAARSALRRGDVIVNIQGQALQGRAGDVSVVKNAIT